MVYGSSMLYTLSKFLIIRILHYKYSKNLLLKFTFSRTPARLTIYVRKYAESQYTAVFLRNFHISELRRKLHPLLQVIILIQ